MAEPSDQWLSEFEVGRMYYYGPEGKLLEYVGAVPADSFTSENPFRDLVPFEAFEKAEDDMVAVFRYAEEPTAHLRVDRETASAFLPALSDRRTMMGWGWDKRSPTDGP